MRKQSDQLVGQHSPAAQLGSGDYKLVPTVLRENDLNSKVTFAKAQCWSINLRYLYFYFRFSKFIWCLTAVVTFQNTTFHIVKWKYVSPDVNVSDKLKGWVFLYLSKNSETRFFSWLFGDTCFSQDSPTTDLWWSYGKWCITVDYTNQQCIKQLNELNLLKYLQQ